MKTLLLVVGLLFVVAVHSDGHSHGCNISPDVRAARNLAHYYDSVIGISTGTYELYAAFIAENFTRVNNGFQTAENRLTFAQFHANDDLFARQIETIHVTSTPDNVFWYFKNTLISATGCGGDNVVYFAGVNTYDCNSIFIEEEFAGDQTSILPYVINITTCTPGSKRSVPTFAPKGVVGM